MPRDDIKDAEAEALREPHISIRVLTKEEAEAEDRIEQARQALKDLVELEG